MLISFFCGFLAIELNEDHPKAVEVSVGEEFSRDIISENLILTAKMETGEICMMLKLMFKNTPTFKNFRHDKMC